MRDAYAAQFFYKKILKVSTDTVVCSPKIPLQSQKGGRANLSSRGIKKKSGSVSPKRKGRTTSDSTEMQIIWTLFVAIGVAVAAFYQAKSPRAALVRAPQSMSAPEVSPSQSAAGIAASSGFTRSPSAVENSSN